jgi:hypothetical protein|tara:strand:+ start:289 stop:519 length:231 start_codon:yes stop_codon:yes gene_type:complete
MREGVVMKVGDYIRVAGRKSNRFDVFRVGVTMRPASDYNALVVGIKSEDSIFHCTVLKSDGRKWNIFKKDIIGDAS